VTTVYSSIEAFLAHYNALSTAARSQSGRATALSPDERDTLAMMELAMSELHHDERLALISTTDTGATAPAAARRHERAQRKLGRILAARGLLQG
jgi:hypothetical protein